METVSDTIDENGKRHLVVKYTDEEKEAMRLWKEKHDREIAEKLKHRPNK